ncbi:MAG TPA: outer membrane protein assembly factor BamD [Terriglobales bacterium]|nr:outer membrane protein assembly factor BamD [Terriglobales bacterium]
MMLRRTLSALLVAALVMSFAACSNKTKNPLADLDSKQPDKVLFDRAMAALQKNKFDVARLTLQTLINTYPESEYVARAKLAVGDAWYQEGGSAALAQAEIEYKDFITFFPNMPEAAEAQLKVADIHYRQMAKPDRDFTHAKRAEEEYKQLLLQFPDSDPERILKPARERLLQVQEVLAEREFRIGWFYYKTRESYAAAVARLQSLVDTYPLYSGASEALYLLGNAYEHQVELVRSSNFSELAKSRLIQQYTDKAAEAYSRILTRYPVTERVEDAKERLAEMKRPIPEPTPEAIALNKAEEESRGKTGMVGRIFSNLRSSPDMARATKVGEPTMVEPTPTSAPEIIRSATRTVEEAGSPRGTVSAEVVRSGSPPPNDPVPSSQPRINDATQPGGVSSEVPAAPPQINYAEAGDTPPAEPSAQAEDGKDDKDKDKKDDDSFSTSKKKKKKGLRKIVPF